MNICFVIGKWEEMDPQYETTLTLIHESCKRGHRVAVFSPGNLTIRDNITYAFCKIIEKNQKVSDSIPSFYKNVKFKKQRLPVKGFDAIFLRKNPPLDNNMLNFLDSVKEDTIIINDIDGLRKASNKIYTTSFEDEHNYIPETHVSKDIDYLESVITEAKADKMILKPLDGYGGKGVIVLETKAKMNIRSLLEFYIGDDNKNYVILQEYLEGATEGDVRVLMLNGEPIGAMKRVPKDGDARSNVHAGGTVEKYSLTKVDREVCRVVGQKLVLDGIYFAGLDIIDGKLLEVNVLSPGGIPRINKLNKVKLQRNVIDFIELMHKKRDDAINRKLSFRKAIDDA
ncbi:MAG: glutathione synthase [Bacteriovoracaceae bacterium]|nr:glutathione synthase [Bacteriovoracaceae bacterium]